MYNSITPNHYAFYMFVSCYWCCYSVVMSTNSPRTSRSRDTGVFKLSLILNTCILPVASPVAIRLCLKQKGESIPDIWFSLNVLYHSMI